MFDGFSSSNDARYKAEYTKIRPDTVVKTELLSIHRNLSWHPLIMIIAYK